MTRTTTHKTTSVVAVVAAFLLLPGLLAACSTAQSPDDRVSDVASGSHSGTSIGECMRGKGHEMPDTSDGGDSESVSAPSGVDEQQWTADLDACAGSSSDGSAGDGVAAAKPGGSPEQNAEIATCLRASGFSDFPDDEDALVSYQPEDHDAFRAASGKCFGEVFGGSGEKVGR